MELVNLNRWLLRVGRAENAWRVWPEKAVVRFGFKMASTTIPDFVIRRADASDVEAMANAHRDSIRSIGPMFYSSNDVDAWQQGLAGDVYLEAMLGGEVFFVASGIDQAEVIFGFSSDYRIAGTIHGTSVYVRGAATRRGIGTALLRRAEAHAVADGATTMQIEASLAGVEFYRANGYTEISRAETRLMSGHPIACVLMRKELTGGGALDVG